MWMVDINWIINSDRDNYGYKFLEKLSRSKNLDLFELDFIKIVIEYLYGRIKNKILYVKLSFFLVRLVVYILTVFYHESIIINEQMIVESLGVFSQHDSHFDIYQVIFGSINCLLSTAHLLIISFETFYLHFAIWKNGWTILEFVASIINLTISLLIVSGSHLYLGILRHLEAFLTVIFAINSLYFLQMNE